MAILPKYASVKHLLKAKMMPTWEIERNEMIRYWKPGDTQASRNYDIPYVDILTYFAAVVVVPTDEGEKIVDNHILKLWNLDMDTPWAQALENLGDANTDEFKLREKEDSKIYEAKWTDGINASRILIPGLFNEFEVSGHPVIFLPDQDTMLVTGTDDDHGLEIGLSALERAQRESDAPLPPFPIAFVDGKYTAVNVVWDHPLYSRFKALKISYDSRAYADQKEIMDTYHGDEMNGAHVARFSTDIDETGYVYSYTTVTPGCESFIPKSDYIAFLSADGDETKTIYSAWDDALDAADDLFEYMQIVPSRYRVKDFPSEEQLLKMGLETKDQEPEQEIHEDKKKTSPMLVS